jgi:hypothetical protein
MLRVVRVAVEKPILDALDDHAAYVGCGVGLSKVLRRIRNRFAIVLAPAAVQVWNSLDFDALRAGHFVALHRRSRTPMGSQP